MKNKTLFMFGFVAMIGMCAQADYSKNEDAVAMIDELVEEYDFNREVLMDVLQEADKKDDIIELMKRPAESINWFNYREIFWQEARIANGVKFIQENQEVLDRALEDYDIPAHVIAAIMGVETNYGGVMGKHRVLDALSTLGFDYPPRATFFRGELKQFLILCCEERIAPFEEDDSCTRTSDENSAGNGRSIEQLVGSYAGAMGYGQFIPSSYRNYSIDYDDDGIRDIWFNVTDAIGSVANYLAEHNWKKDGKVAEFVTLDADSTVSDHFNDSLKPSLTVAEWRELGVISESEDDLSAALFAYVADDGDPPTQEIMLGFDNFYVITRYNHSRLYARIVNDLAMAIAERIDNP